MKKKADDTETLMQEGVQQALELAKEAELNLDFSDESIEEVEKLLGEIRKEYQKTGEEDGLVGLSIMIGAYIGEVIRKKGFGGTWSRDHPDMGEDSFPFHWRGSDLFLYGWCLKRILDGEGDNVAFKYRCLILEKLKS